MAHGISLENTGNRLIWHNLVQTDLRESLLQDVRRGLTAEHKHLFPKYLYDALGSTLFEAICLLPEYYLTRAEHEILTRYAADIVGAWDEPVTLCELGSGNADKTRLLLDALLQRQESLHYVVTDISQTALESSSRALLQDYPRLRITAYASDYFNALKAMQQEQRGPTLAVFLGSNIGNFAYDDALEFLRAVRGALQTGDGLLLGADLRKEKAVLEAAYDDELGVTAAFNRNILARLNHELDADFNVRAFRHIAEYNADEGCVGLYLESRKAQAVTLRALDLTVNFAAGERLHTENSCKYTSEQLAQMAHATGFVPMQQWFDERRQFSSNLWRAI